MNKYELAKQLDGVDYRDIHDKAEDLGVKYPEFLIVVPYSDDLICTFGTIEDEYDAFDGRGFNVVDGAISETCDEEGDIIASWSDGAAWKLTSKRDYASFTITDKHEPKDEYPDNGIIIDKKDLDIPQKCTICNKQTNRIDKVMVGGNCFCKNCIINVALGCGTETISDLIEISKSEDPKKEMQKRMKLGWISKEGV